ncbi:peptidoglycan editing factor PgeF [Chryseomicrobium palamuruense]|uniref:Purine nucleoside phosphorylase n=1 Tax=Chryseomicrobium palamuruense TaxID=682973 RepID=A0ABV8UWP0_9BACL
MKLEHPITGVTWGITMKSHERPENNNMALHTCENPEDILANREVLAQELGVPLDQFVLANQTHSDHCHEVTAADQGRGAFSVDTAIPDTDALFTYEPDLVLGTFTADCVPMLFWSTSSQVIGSVHSGWQGTVKEIVPKLLVHLKEEKKEELSNVHVVLGPALSQEKFEVDADVAEKYKVLGYADEWIVYKEETNKYHIDNAQTVRAQCLRAGILPEHIHVSPVCTFQAADGFSYRQNKQDGRHLGFIFRHND